MSKVKPVASKRRSYEYDHDYGLRSEAETGGKPSLGRPTKTKQRAKQR